MSLLLQRGRCRFCHARVPVFHVIVEILTPVTFVLLYRRYGISLEFMFSAAFCCTLIIIGFIDLRWLKIPNILIGVLLLLGVLKSALGPEVAWYPYVAGIVVGSALLWIPGAVSQLLLGRETLGMGDIKLAAALGFFLGWQGIVVILWLACLTGAAYGIVGITLHLLPRTSKIPLGFFIALAAIGYSLFGYLIDL